MLIGSPFTPVQFSLASGLGVRWEHVTGACNRSRPSRALQSVKASVPKEADPTWWFHRRLRGAQHSFACSARVPRLLLAVS